MLDFAGLSQTAQSMLDNKQEEKNSQLAELGTQIGQFREQGMTDDEIFKKISSDGSTTRRIASRLAKLYDKKDGFSRGDNPVFKLALQSVRGDARAQAVRRKSGELLAEATARVARGKPEDREKLIVQELATLRNESADLLNPDELGYFGTQTAEQALQKINADYANALSTGAAAQQLAEAQTEVRGQFLDVTQRVIDAWRKPGANPFAAQASAVEMFGVIGENAKFIGVHTEEELGQYVYSAAGEIKLAVGAKEAGEFLSYAMDNLRNGNGVAYLDGDLKAQQELDALHRAAEFEEQNRYFQAQRERETLRAAMTNSPVGLSLRASVTDKDSTGLLDKSKNAQKMILEGTPESIKAAFGIEIGPNQKGIALDWLQDTTVQLTRTQSAYSEVEYQGIESAIMDQSVSDPEGAVRTLDAANLNAVQYVALQEKLRAFKDSGASEVYASVTAGRRLEQTVAEAVLQTVPRDFEGNPLDRQAYADDVRAEIAIVRNRIAGDSTLIERLKTGSIEIDNFYDSTIKEIRDRRGVKTTLTAADGQATNVSDAQSIGSVKPGTDPSIVKSRRERYAAKLNGQADYRSGKAMIGGISPADVDTGFLSKMTYGYVESVNDLATRDLGVESLASMFTMTSREGELYDAILRFNSRSNDVKDPEQKWAITSEALALSGFLSSTDLSLSGEKLAARIARGNTDRKIEYGDRLDLSNFNILSARLSDTKDAHKWFTRDPLNNLVLTKDLPEDMRRKLSVVLATNGVEPSTYNLLQFISYQAAEWGKNK
jgi:hypothetical protein